MTKLLVEHGADIKAQDHEGKTALDMAKAINQREIVEYLERIRASE